MIEVFLSINNNEEVMQLPVPIEPYQITSPWSNETYESLTQELNLIGLRRLKTLSISSFFPIRDYPFLQNRNMWGKEYVDTIERWRDRRLPLRIIITNSDANMLNINMPVTIEEFTYESHKSGDIHFTLSLREFAFVNIKVGG